MSVGPGHFAVLGGLVLAIGLYGVLTRRGAPAVLLAAAVLSIAPVIALVGLAHLGRSGQVPATGDAFAFLALVGLGAVCALATGITLLLWRRLRTAEVDDLVDADG